MLARIELKRVLRELHHHLPLAARNAGESAEHVHRLRIAARRGLTVVRVASDLLRPRDRRRLRRLLRAVRRAAGDARDLDVLLARFAGRVGGETEPGTRALVADVRARRVAAQEPITTLHARLASDDRWSEREARILRRIARRGRDTPARTWAIARLGHVFARFIDAVPVDFRDTSALHRYRIRAKDLRYALEALSPALPRRLIRRLEPTVTELQRRLGDVHDRAVQADRFRAWEQASADPVLAAHLSTLAEREAAELAVAVDELVEWWRPHTEARFLAEFVAGLEWSRSR